MPSRSTTNRVALVRKYLTSPEARRRVSNVLSGRRSTGGLEWISDEDLTKAIDTLVASGELPVLDGTDYGYHPIRRIPMIGGEFSEESIDRLIEQEDEPGEDDFSDVNPGEDDELNEMDGGELVDKFLSMKGIHHWEGERGVSGLEDLAQALNSEYRDLNYFLVDNPGALEAIANWISEWADRTEEWKESLRNAIRNTDPEEVRRRRRW